MANIMNVLPYLIIIMRIIVEVNSLHVISPQKNYIMASEDKTWADNQIKKAENKCNEYKQYACQYQTPDRKNSDKDPILNGEYVSQGMLPHMAYLHINTENKITVKNIFFESTSGCTGTLISEKFVLTATHCIRVADSNSDIIVKLGSLYSSNDGTGQWYSVDQLYEHPYYSLDEYLLYDIGLIKLSETVHFNFYVRPICLSTNYDIGQDNSVIAAGWGDTEHGRTDCLKMAELTTRESACDFMFQSKSKYYDVVKLYTICAEGTLKATCKGDSGGPLQVQINNACPNTYTQIGVTVSGEGNCSLSSSFNIGVYTKVAPYVPWIASIVWPS
ncbi:chymotrypsin-like elastase family member 1 [Planococcus citri]|uniref:chymotrypsin-like elastase family member 1 n=1 Tax=Planococcus citri TaxID=170843 RepID=UPI0031F87496